jgi:hypothetical protein
MMIEQVRGTRAPWDERIQALWDERVAPLFADGETCSHANYFSPRPYVDEYNRATRFEGFCYTVQPGYRVCIKEWFPS